MVRALMCRFIVDEIRTVDRRRSSRSFDQTDYFFFRFVSCCSFVAWKSSCDRPRQLNMIVYLLSMFHKIEYIRWHLCAGTLSTRTMLS